MRSTLSRQAQPGSKRLIWRMSKKPQGRSKESGRKKERLKTERRRKSATVTFDALRKDFQKAHKDGMAALTAGDFDALGDAIKRERDIIEKQKKSVAKRIQKQSSRP